MPNAPRTPSRNVRVDDAVWHAAQAKAAKEGTTVAAVVVAALEAYAGVETPQVPRRPRGCRCTPVPDGIDPTPGCPVHAYLFDDSRGLEPEPADS